MNPVSEFFRRRSILAACEEAIAKQATTLNLSRFEMEEVPKLLEKLETLMKLFLNNNQLTRVSSKLAMRHITHSRLKVSHFAYLEDPKHDIFLVSVSLHYHLKD